MNPILKHVPWTEILNLADVLSEGGMNDAEVAKEIASFIDQILDFEVLVKGPAGVVLENIDGHILLAAISVIIKLSKGGRDKRKATRHKKFEILKLPFDPSKAVKK